MSYNEKKNTSLSKFYTSIVLERPRFTLFVMSLVLVFFSYFFKDFKLDASADALLLESDEDLQIFRQINERYSTLELLVVTFTPHADLFSDPSLQSVRQLRDELARLDKINSIVSIIDVPLVKIIDGKLSEVVNQYKTLEDGSTDRQLAKQELLDSPLFSDLIISSDGETTALLIYLEANQEYLELQKSRTNLLLRKRTEGLSREENLTLKEISQRYDKLKTDNDTAVHRLIEQIRQVIGKYKNSGTVHLGGVPMVVDDMITFVKNDLIIFGSSVLTFLIVMLSIIFRQLRWITLPLIICVFSGMLMIGLLGLIGWRITVISSNFVSLILILTMSMNVHLIVRYRELLWDMPKASHHDLISKMIGKMIQPCLYTALTTMIGFSSLFVSDIKPVTDFGWMMTIGLIVTFLTTFLLFPSTLILLKKAGTTTTQFKSVVTLTTGLAVATERHGRAVLIISLILATISIYGISQLRVENSFINYFSENTEIYQGQKLIDEQLGGTTPLDIILKFNEPLEAPLMIVDQVEDESGELDALFKDVETDVEDSWFTDYKIGEIKAVHNYLDSLPEVGKVLSLDSFLRLTEDLNQGQALEVFELAVIYKNLSDKLKASLIDPYISIDHDEARVTVRILDSMPDLRRKELLDKINQNLSGELGLSVDEFQITGLLVLYNNLLQSLFRSQILTLGAVMLGIALMLLVLFQSLTLAIIGIIPNLLTALIILGLMGLFNISLDMMTITIAAITIGIATDDCIHYIYRFREEFSRTGNYIETMHYCHASTGRAMFYTSICIAIGFSILVISNFVPTIYFGLLTTLAMLVALLAALTLLPRLILLWEPF